jgi:hypothetical protein
MPGESALVSTMERFCLPNNIAMDIKDKSSLARQFVVVQNTMADPGWQGHLTIEVSNHGINPVSFLVGDAVCQVVFELLDEPTEQPYRGKYQNQSDAPVEAKRQHKAEVGQRVRLVKELPITLPKPPLLGCPYQCPAPVGTTGIVTDHSDVYQTTFIALDGYGIWSAADEHFELVVDSPRKTYTLEDLRKIAREREKWAAEGRAKDLRGTADETELTAQLARWVIQLLEERS